jgi:hypothetical protein
MGRTRRAATLISKDEAVDVFARAASAGQGADGDALEPAAPAPTLVIGTAQATALRAALDSRCALRVDAAWPDEVLQAAGADVHAAVPSREAPSVALIRAWIANHWRAPELPAPQARRTRQQTELLTTAAKDGTYTPSMSDEQLRPLLDALKEAGKKVLAPADVRELLRTLATKESTAQAGAALEAQPQPSVPTPEQVTARLDALEDTVVGASPYGVRHRHHAPPRRCVHKHADKRLSHPTECDQAVTKLLDLLEEADGGAPSLEESAQQRGARLRLTAEHEPAAQELLKRVRAAHAEYAVLLAAVGQLPTPDERSNAKEQLKVLAQPLTGGVAVMSTLVRCFTEAEAAGAAKAPKPRGKKRRHCDQPAPEQVGCYRKAATRRVKTELARVAAWTMTDTLSFIRAPTQLHGTVTALSAKGNKLKDEHIQRIQVVIEQCFAEADANPAAPGGAPTGCELSEDELMDG